MAILFWLLPTLVVTCAASAWVGWISKGRPALGDRSEEAQAKAQQRMAEALARPAVGQAGRRGGAFPRERSTGVAVRRPE